MRAELLVSASKHCLCCKQCEVNGSKERNGMHSKDDDDDEDTAIGKVKVKSTRILGPKCARPKWSLSHVQVHETRPIWVSFFTRSLSVNEPEHAFLYSIMNISSTTAHACDGVASRNVRINRTANAWACVCVGSHSFIRSLFQSLSQPGWLRASVFFPSSISYARPCPEWRGVHSFWIGR